MSILFGDPPGAVEDPPAQTERRPLGEAAQCYLEAGWTGVLPLPARQKASPPLGTTGAAGVDLSADRILELAQRNPSGNIGLRLPDDVIGIDVDAYDGKPGAATLAKLEAERGPLPPTWTSSARSSPSGVRLFRVPPGHKWIDVGPGIETLQRAHRYAVVPPSIHPDGGEYRWITPDGEPSETPPAPHELPALPESWVDHLTAPDPRPAVTAERQVVAPGGGGWVSAIVEDYNRRTTWREVLAGRFEHLYDRGGEGYWHFVGAANDVSATTNALGTDTLIVFSATAGAAGFEIAGGAGPATSYDRFSAAVILATGRNDHDARVDTARSLQERGYGPPPPARRAALDVTWSEGLPVGAVASGAKPDRLEVGRLPATFWTHHQHLEHIRDAAWSRLVSPEAVLVAVLARIVAVSPHIMELPAIIGNWAGLSLVAGVVGPSNVGKSAAIGVACDLVPRPLDLNIADGMPLGSGEGLVELLMGLVTEEDPNTGRPAKVRRQVRHNAFVPVDEGQVLGDLASRAGSTLATTLRTIFSHGTIGQSNASADRTRIARGTHYVFGVVLGLQPAKAGPLLDDAGGGTPQRIVWATALAPRPPDTADPGPLPWNPPSTHQLLDTAEGRSRDGMRRAVFDVADDVAHQIREDHLAALAGTGCLAEHHNLRRLKVAAALALLMERGTSIDVDAWELAGAVMDASTEVLASMAEHLAEDEARRRQAADERFVRRTAEASVKSAEAHEARALASGAKSAGRHVHRHAERDGKGCTRSCISQSINGDHRKLVAVDDIFTAAIEAGWIERREDGKWWPGTSRPA